MIWKLRLRKKLLSSCVHLHGGLAFLASELQLIIPIKFYIHTYIAIDRENQ